jgi:rare lipoprotein A
MRTITTGLFMTALLAAGGACIGAAPAQADNPPGFQSPRFIESGEASWYGPRHEGRRTTSGEVFDSHKLTAAHPSLPLGSYVRVTVQDTGRSIVVKVNDREPPHGVRCIDLSHAAAQRLGIAGLGVADVTLEAASKDEAVEVAEAPDDDAAGSAPRHASSRHGRPHKRHARR